MHFKSSLNSKSKLYFVSTAIFAFIISALLVSSKNFDLNLNDSDSVITLIG